MQIIGHRGAAGLAVENTIESFNAAIAANAWGIELDLRLTKDGYFAVSHDSSIKLSNGTKLPIEQSTIDELKAATADLPVPVLSGREAIRHILKADSSTMINIEVKGKNWARPVGRLLDNFAAAERKRFIISSFYLKDLRSLRIQYPQLRFLYLYRKIPIGLNLLAAKKDGAWGVGFSVHYGSRLLVLASKNVGLTTVVYTVNSVRKAKQLSRMGVDYIITDFPDRFGILAS